MNRCPITYELCGERRYSEAGLKKLGRTLSDLQPFPFGHDQQMELASDDATKLSLQGVQPKFCSNLDGTKQQFVPVDRGGKFIMKPAHLVYKELPQNEDLTMRLAATAGIEVPLHGLVYCADESLIYFIRRFDRDGRGRKHALEDFAQLSGGSRNTKYDSSMEQLVQTVDTYCTFPMIERIKLLRLTLFCFLVGNEDFHLKNLSLLHKEDKVELSPAYDLVSSTILIRAREELALPLAGQKSRLKRADFIDYYALKRMQLRSEVVDGMLGEFASCLAKWRELIDHSFLSDTVQEKYHALIQERAKRLALL